MLGLLLPLRTFCLKRFPFGQLHLLSLLTMRVWVAIAEAFERDPSVKSVPLSRSQRTSQFASGLNFSASCKLIIYRQHALLFRLISIGNKPPLQVHLVLKKTVLPSIEYSPMICGLERVAGKSLKKQ